MLRGIAWAAIPISVWMLFTLGGNFLVRHRGFGARALIVFGVAAIPCGLLALLAVIGLARNDGWRGLGVFSLIIPVVLPIVVLGVYCLAAVLVSIRIRRGWREARLD
jgi:ABC-type spermidine/putrescine transport system permease subunit II